jgi:hypothetical protein
MSLFDDEIGKILSDFEPMEKGSHIDRSGRDSDVRRQVPLPPPTHQPQNESPTEQNESPIANQSENSGEQKISVNNSLTRPKRNTAISRRNALDALDQLCEASIPRMQGWLDQIAEDDGPKAAMDTLIKLLDFFTPKLARQELTGAGGNALQISVVKFGQTVDEEKATETQYREVE